jgi:hypothetical protein
MWNFYLTKKLKIQEQELFKIHKKVEISTLLNIELFPTHTKSKLDMLGVAKVEPPISGQIRNLAFFTWNMDVIFLHTS